MTPAELLDRLRGLRGVTVDVATTETKDVGYYILHFTQPIDHNDPTLGTFQQEVSLLHRSELAPVPMIVHTSGYRDSYNDRPVELTQMLGANQVSIEHRHYGHSRPDPIRWDTLTIEQMAADEHAIIAALRTIYAGAFLSTGASKGGTTAVIHRAFYPDDVDGTVAYVAPISFGVPDPRYPAFFDTVGTQQCREAVRAVAMEMLANRRAQLEARAQAQTSCRYTRVAIGPAVEAAIVSLEWTFWQYLGAEVCGQIPAVTASDDEMFAFLERVSPVSDNDDENLAVLEPYYYQSYAQLGFPDDSVWSLAPYRRYPEDAYEGRVSDGEPCYDMGEAMRKVDDYVEHRGERLLFIYGQWDPWTAGRFVRGNADDTRVFVQPRGTHRATIGQLMRENRETALAMLKAWTGVTPTLVYQSVALGPEPPGRRLSPVLAPALAARR